MKVGYVSELNVMDSGRDFINCILNLVSISVNESLDYLIVSGGISNNYHITLSFIEELGRQLRISNVKLRFIVGNTDFYYSKDESVVDKIKKFREILSLYRRSEYYLPRNPIITRRVRIVGTESWYDYSLYRGKPRNLKEITRKKILFFRNKDNEYITDESDYTLGLENTFDIMYSKECVDSLRNSLSSGIQKHGQCDYNVVVSYFKASKYLLGQSFISKYMGTFEGSLEIGNTLKQFSVNQCIVGKKCNRDSARIDGILYINPANDREVKVVTYE